MPDGLGELNLKLLVPPLQFSKMRFYGHRGRLLLNQKLPPEHYKVCHGPEYKSILVVLCTAIPRHADALETTLGIRP
jgi:hypothetical protein